MTVPAPPTLTPAPSPAPTRTDPANFNVRADAYHTWLVPNVNTELPAMLNWIEDRANETEGWSNDAEQSVTDAAGQVGLAADQVALAAQQVTLAQQQATASANSAAASAASASTAINAPGTNATSTTSAAIGAGSKTLTVQTGKLFVPGQPVMIARTSAPSTAWMAGNVTAYNSGTGALTVDVVWTNGTGTFSDWTVSLAGPALPDVVRKSGDTMSGNLTVPSLTVTGLLDWDATVLVINTNTTALKSRTYVLTASVTLTLPASPAAGDWVAFANRSGTSTPVIARNGQNIMGLAENMTLDNINHFGTLVYADATRGWIFQ